MSRAKGSWKNRCLTLTNWLRILSKHVIMSMREESQRRGQKLKPNTQKLAVD